MHRRALYVPTPEPGRGGKMAHDDFDVGRREALESQARRVSVPLAAVAGWMKLLAVLTVASAVVSVIASLWSLLFVWLPIWSSVLLYAAATRVTSANSTGSEAELVAALDRLRLYFLITGVVALIGLVLVVVAMFSGVPISLTV
jgi:hypothetical protein